jgi:hypothetical protein
MAPGFGLNPGSTVPATCCARSGSDAVKTAATVTTAGPRRWINRRIAAGSVSQRFGGTEQQASIRDEQGGKLRGFFGVLCAFARFFVSLPIVVRHRPLVTLFAILSDFGFCLRHSSHTPSLFPLPPAFPPLCGHRSGATDPLPLSRRKAREAAGREWFGRLCEEDGRPAIQRSAMNSELETLQDVRSPQGSRLAKYRKHEVQRTTVHHLPADLALTIQKKPAPSVPALSKEYRPGVCASLRLH